MMAGTSMPPASGTGKSVAVDTPSELEKVKRLAHPSLECAENLAGTSSVPARGQPLLAIIDRLLEPVQFGDDLE
jgi:hypothetical protein